MPNQINDELDYELGDLWSRAFNTGSAHNPKDPSKDIETTRRAIHRYAQKCVIEELKEIHLRKDGEICTGIYGDSRPIAERIAILEKELDDA